MTGHLDQEKLEKFAGRMMGILNGGMLSLMTSIGYRTGLFEALTARPGPCSVEEVAEAAGLDERYVREWLDTMVAGRIVEYLPDEDRYVFPPEHAALMTRSAGPDNMAVFAATIPLLGNLENEFLDCFQRGGGVSYDRYDEFLGLWSGFTAQRFDCTLISKVLPLMPEVVRALEEGIDVLDIGCGTGHSTNLMAQNYPKSRFTLRVSRQHCR